jgi:hypothetical protein
VSHVWDGESPRRLGPRRAAGTNPRTAIGLGCSRISARAGATNPRALGTNPRARRRPGGAGPNIPRQVRQLQRRMAEEQGRTCSRCDVVVPRHGGGPVGWYQPPGVHGVLRCDHRGIPLIFELMAGGAFEPSRPSGEEGNDLPKVWGKGEVCLSIWLTGPFDGEGPSNEIKGLNQTQHQSIKRYALISGTT